ncbi:STN domain-containing protein, partial [Persicitalea sp.]|uniref:STN domain-containing protein n=1 Tax=Persicitalea sp. TaxID=3100273 RepID=UPI0035933430
MDKKFTKFSPFARIMKLSAIQFLIAGFFMTTTWAHVANGQEILDQRIHVKANSTSLKSALNYLERNSNVRFIYNPREIGVDQRVTLVGKSATLKEFLNELLSPLQIRYEVSGKQIALFKKLATSTNASDEASSSTLT